MKTLHLPPIIIGAMRFGSWGAKMNHQELAAFVDGCLEMELSAFDHADIYGDYTTESDFGELLKNNSSLRGSMQIITKSGIRKMAPGKPHYKINSYDSSKEHIISSLEASLMNLQTDYIDVLLVHRPDYLMDPEEIAEAFYELQKDGKVLHFGVSNFTPSQFELLNNSFELVTNQIEISLIKRDALDDGTLSQCMLKGIRPMAWSPMGGGALFLEGNETAQRILLAGEELSRKYDCEIDHLLYAWLLRHPAGILPVTGTSKLDRVKTAKEALDIHLEREDWYKLLEAAVGSEVP